jgi:hypothetical protein
MVRKRNDSPIGIDLVPQELLRPGEDQYTIRNLLKGPKEYRSLTAREVEILVKNGNCADNWNSVLVDERFSPDQVERCSFHGLVRIGALEEGYLEHHDLQLPIGLRDCTIISCDLGDNVALRGVSYLSCYIIRDEVILMNIQEMGTTNHSKFGNGIVMDGEDPSVRVELELGNENGGRSVYPFDGMLAGDAYLWSRYRENVPLMSALEAMTDSAFDHRRGTYGLVGKGSVIKSCRIIKDIKVGEGAYIKGANKLKNLTINSSEHLSTQIGEGVELVNGIIGYGCRIFYGVKAVRFILANHSNLKYGARLINSFLGENSTISCCEVLNALIFPGHEQHHNNSFLCAATVQGQSNIAAGATIGSNHNSRGPDGEIFAGRGFWPALCTSLKHNSRFAPFTIMAKGAYPAELNIPLPFTLVSNNETAGRIDLMPCYWFRYNMYALARNAWKYGARDKRQDPAQVLEFDYLAPDTANEMIKGMRLLEVWAGMHSDNVTIRSYEYSDELLAFTFAASGAVSGSTFPEVLEATARKGRALLSTELKTHQDQKGPEAQRDLQHIDSKEIPAWGIEKGKRPAVVLRSSSAYNTYYDMLLLYGIRNILAFCSRQKLTLQKGVDRLKALQDDTSQEWHNIGGQLVTGADLQQLQDDIVNKKLITWEAVHERYRELGKKYPDLKAAHACQTLLKMTGPEPDFKALLHEAVRIQDNIAVNTRVSREKDYTSDFRRMVYDNPRQMEEVLGTVDDNDFIRHIEQESRDFSSTVAAIISAL